MIIVVFSDDECFIDYFVILITTSPAFVVLMYDTML